MLGSWQWSCKAECQGCNWKLFETSSKAFAKRRWTRVECSQIPWTTSCAQWHWTQWTTVHCIHWCCEKATCQFQETLWKNNKNYQTLDKQTGHCSFEIAVINEKWNNWNDGTNPNVMWKQRSCFFHTNEPTGQCCHAWLQMHCPKQWFGAVHPKWRWCFKGKEQWCFVVSSGRIATLTRWHIPFINRNQVQRETSLCKNNF